MSPSITARIVHAALVLGVMLFVGMAWQIGTNGSIPASALPDRRVLYLGLFVVSAVLFGAAKYTAARLTPPGPGVSHDFRTLIAPFTGLLLFVNYRPSRLVEG